MKKKLINLLLVLCMAFALMGFIGCGEKGEKGDQGITGATGVGIQSIEKIGTENLTDTYKILYTDGNSTTFTVTNGANGTNGENGSNGQDGVSVTNATINADGELVLTFSKGEPLNLGKIVGTDGDDGDDGVGIENVTLSATGDLAVKLTSGTTLELGNIKGQKGDDGVSVSKTEINEKGELVIALSNGFSTNLGNVIGAKGDTGVGIEKIELSDSYELTIYLTDDSILPLGNIRGEKGETGADGKSAFELYQAKYEYEGNEEQWLFDLVNGNLATHNKYTVTFNADGATNPESQTVQFGYKATEPTAPEKEGYIFKGWFINGEKWSFVGYPVTEDITLTAQWQKAYDLSAIAFNDVSYTYDGTEKSVRLTGNVPTSLTVEYTDNTLTNAGSTNATATIKGSDGYVYAELHAKLTIEKATVTGISFEGDTVDYDGKAHSLSIDGNLPDGVSVNYVNNAKTNAGVYTVKAQFSVNENYNEIAEMQATLNIKPIEAKIWAEDKTVTYNGLKQKITAVSEAMPVNDLPYLQFENNEKADVGEYAVTVRTITSNNYIPVEPYTVKLTILPATVKVIADDKTSVYGETLKSLTYTVEGTIYNNDFTPTVSKQEGVSAGEYVITLSAEHKNYTITLQNATYTIQKAVYDMSGVSFKNAEYTYDGNEKAIKVSGELPDGVVAYYENNTATTAGNHLATAYFRSDNRNYEDIDLTLTALLIINKATYNVSTFSFTGKTYTYDGTEKQLTVDGALTAGLTVTYENHVLTEVGTIAATAKFDGDFDNYYKVGDMTAILTVQKATYDMSEIAFADTGFVYDGTAKTFVIDGELPQGVSVAYTPNVFTNAGEYPVTATFTGDSKNYHEIEPMTTTFTIQKATYDMSGLTFEAKTYTYDGTKKSVELVGTLPDGVAAECFNCEKTNAGVYEATASFAGDTRNYNLIPDMVTTLTIEKAIYDMSGVTFEGNTATYNTNIVALAITGELPAGVSVAYENNENVNAGTHIVTAVFTGDSKNYETIESMTAELIIEKVTPDLTPTYNSENFTFANELLLNANTAIEGVITLDEGQTLAIGTKFYYWTFTPTDSNNYNVAQGRMSITVYACVEFYNYDGALEATQYVEKGGYITSISADYADESGYA